MKQEQLEDLWARVRRAVNADDIEAMRNVRKEIDDIIANEIAEMLAQSGGESQVVDPS